ncbi:MAG: hypothetical protein GWP14_08005 [Actinobacteria bacterium]|nr:hypothetical protein [Actinomycetota bacterium]
MFYSRKKTPYGPRHGWSRCVWLLFCVLPLFLGGCPIGAVVALFVKKDPMVVVEAEYEFTADKLLVLVDSPTERTGLSGIRPLLSRRLAEEISRYNLVPAVVPAGELAVLRISTDDFGQLSIPEVGRRLSADQVLYVKVMEFSLGTMVDKPVGRGIARARVTVFDVAQDRRVWPKDRPLGREVLVRTPFREPTGQDYRQEFAEDLSKRTAESVIKLFREHEEPRKPADR